MSSRFEAFRSDMNHTIQSAINNGLPYEQILGGLEASKLYVSFLLEEEYKRRAVVASWEATKKQFEPKSPDLPLVEATEDN